MRKEIERITGRSVREAAAEIETETGTVVHAFTTGAMVQVFLLGPGLLPKQDRASIDKAEDDGLRVMPPTSSQNDSSLRTNLKENDNGSNAPKVI